MAESNIALSTHTAQVLKTERATKTTHLSPISGEDTNYCGGLVLDLLRPGRYARQA